VSWYPLTVIVVPTVEGVQGAHGRDDEAAQSERLCCVGPSLARYIRHHAHLCPARAESGAH
jgi:hypothetical protein